MITCVGKFERNPSKPVGEVVFTRFCLPKLMILTDSRAATLEGKVETKNPAFTHNYIP